MLVELAVRDLGVIAEARIPLPPGLTALTGETGAGKTMVVEALGLLCGARPDPSRVRPGADAAVVEGLFADGDGSEGVGSGGDGSEWVLRRVVPSSGRSRAYVDGGLSTAADMAELGGRSIEIHGQHAQQALLAPRHQRDALDRFAGIDTTALRDARAAVANLEQRLADLGGDERARAHEIDLLRHQIDEIASVDPTPGEEDDLAAEEDLLADAVAHREAAAAALEALGGDGAVLDGLAVAAESLRGRAPFAAEAVRLDAIGPELRDVLAELRSRAESIEPDDARLDEVRGRRHRLVELRRKYGDDLDEVVEHAATARRRLDELTSLDSTRESVERELAEARSLAEAEGRRVGEARRAAAPALAERLVELLADLALPASRIEIGVTDRDGRPGAGDDVELLIATNPGAPLGGLARVASGGELSRVMLALRLVLSGGPDVMVFDEIDAGVGGEAAAAVGAALARLAEGRQVVVVTHLPQVAAFADHQLLVAKHTDGTTTLTTVETLDDDDRVIELSRMMTGRPDSATARDHAEELLASSAEVRGRR
ncbi:MAG: DNA repair protein RecN [Microthrixaceae bacterium]